MSGSFSKISMDIDKRKKLRQSLESATKLPISVAFDDNDSVDCFYKGLGYDLKVFVNMGFISNLDFSAGSGLSDDKPVFSQANLSPVIPVYLSRVHDKTQPGYLKPMIGSHAVYLSKVEDPMVEVQLGIDDPVESLDRADCFAMPCLYDESDVSNRGLFTCLTPEGPVGVSMSDCYDVVCTYVEAMRPFLFGIDVSMHVSLVSGFHIVSAIWAFDSLDVRNHENHPLLFVVRTPYVVENQSSGFTGNVFVKVFASDCSNAKIKSDGLVISHFPAVFSKDRCLFVERGFTVENEPEYAVYHESKFGSIVDVFGKHVNAVDVLNSACNYVDIMAGTPHGRFLQEVAEKSAKEALSAKKECEPEFDKYAVIHKPKNIVPVKKRKRGQLL